MKQRPEPFTDADNVFKVVGSAGCVIPRNFPLIYAVPGFEYQPLCVCLSFGIMAITADKKKPGHLDEFGCFSRTKDNQSRKSNHVRFTHQLRFSPLLLVST